MTCWKAWGSSVQAILVNRNNAAAWLAGLCCVYGFAPFGWFIIPLLAQAVLFYLWARTAPPRAAAALGFSFGLGLFAAGVSWIYISLHDFGGMPAWLAALALLLFTAFLSLFTALAGYLQAVINQQLARFNPRPPGVEVWHALPDAVRVLLVMPAIWVLIERVRGMIFTGFPWLTLGYAHSDSPLAGYAPLLGAYGVSLLAAICAGLLALLALGGAGRKKILLALIVFWAVAALLRTINWTTAFGAPFSVTLVQGNIGQDIKFDENQLYKTLVLYRDLVVKNPAKLTVLPETALPMMRDDLPQTLLDQLREHARRNAGDVLTGVFEQDRNGYYNSVIALGESEKSAVTERYRKHHLVVFGEYIPFRPVFGWLINQVLHIPMGDLARGAPIQAPMQAAGQRVAVDICYEDVFGEEIIHSLPAATLLVNVTNDGWFGDSFAAAQHNQMSQFRALETGRMMLRATNSGITSIVDVHGKVLQQLPEHQQAVLRGMAQGYQGSTPYVRWGNRAVTLLIALMLIAAWRFAVRR